MHTETGRSTGNRVTEGLTGKVICHRSLLVITLLAAGLTGCGSEAEADPNQTALRLLRVSDYEAQLLTMEEMVAAEMSLDQAIAFRSVLDSSELMQRLVPLYTRTFTVREMEDAIRFFESDSGRKFAESAPAVTREATRITEEYLREKQAALPQPADTAQ